MDALLILVPRVQYHLGSEPHRDLTLWNHRLGKFCQDVTKEHVIEECDQYTPFLSHECVDLKCSQDPRTNNKIKIQTLGGSSISCLKACNQCFQALPKSLQKSIS